jgi:hypothetical protein
MKKMSCSEIRKCVNDVNIFTNYVTVMLIKMRKLYLGVINSLLG